MAVKFSEPQFHYKTWEEVVGENWRIDRDWLYGSYLYKITVEEKLNVVDTLVRNGEGVYSDILFEPGEWTEESVNNAVLKGKHVGYENFRPFIYGDYRYKDALFRTVMDATGGDRGVLEQFQITVDVPDLIDRGSAEVLDKNYDLTVEFSKKFHIAPEVVITMRSGSSAVPVVPVIVNTTEKSFTMYLQNAITSERVTGRFIWMATGY